MTKKCDNWLKWRSEQGENALFFYLQNKNYSLKTTSKLFRISSNCLQIKLSGFKEQNNIKSICRVILPAISQGGVKPQKEVEE